MLFNSRAAALQDLYFVSMLLQSNILTTSKEHVYHHEDMRMIMQKKNYSLVALMMIFNRNDPPSDVICWIYMFERIRCMDGGIVLREVVIIHTVWNRVAIPSGYLPETMKNIFFSTFSDVNFSFHVSS